MIPEPVLQMAHAYRLLSELDHAQLRKLLPLLEEKHFDAGQIIFREGDKAAFLHLIVSGEVVLETIAGNDAVPVQQLRHGEAIGWSALTRDHAAHFRARALTDVDTVAFPSERLAQACDRDPAMGYHLMRQLLEVVTERLDAVRKQLLEQAKAGQH